VRALDQDIEFLVGRLEAHPDYRVLRRLVMTGPHRVLAELELDESLAALRPFKARTLTWRFSNRVPRFRRGERRQAIEGLGRR